MSNPNPTDYVRSYFARLTSSDYAGIIDMFEADGQIDSPYLGKMLARDFFAKLGNASQENKLTVFDVC